MAKSKEVGPFDEAGNPTPAVTDDSQASTPAITAPTFATPESTACPQSLAECSGARTYRGIVNGGHWYECEACGHGAIGDKPN